MYIFGVSNVSISKVMRHFSNCFLFKFFNFSFICPKKYIQYTRNKYCNMKKWLLKLYLTKKSVFMENSNCFFGSERLIWNPKNIHWPQPFLLHVKNISWLDSGFVYKMSPNWLDANFTYRKNFRVQINEDNLPRFWELFWNLTSH